MTDSSCIIKNALTEISLKQISLIEKETSSDISTDEPKATTHAPHGEKKATAHKEKPIRQKEKNTTPVERKEKKPSREERGYTAPRGKKFKKEDWMQFLNPDKPQKKHELKGEMPDFSEEGWARRKPKKKK